jgi:hypothetical protein
MVTRENILLEKTNGRGYRISFLAKFQESLFVCYIVRVVGPKGHKVDYTCGLKSLRDIGELLTSLCFFAETEFYQDEAKLKNVLTAENLKSFADNLKSTNLK